MIYLLHGDDVVSSRKTVSELTVGFQITSLDGKSVSVATLEENLVSTSLFDEKKVVVVENLLSKNSKKKDFVKFLNSFESDVLLILWEDKKLLKTTTNTLKKAVIRDFLLPQNYFQFLDSFAPGNSKRLYSMYHELLKTMTAEQVFYSLLKRLRLLTVISSGGTIGELSKMAPWQQGKLNQQVRLWPQSKLSIFYAQFSQLEIRMKSGGLPLGLSKHLDMLILSELI